VSGGYYICVRVGRSEHVVLVGPRGSAACETHGPDLTDAISDVPSWVHRDRVGARKCGLRGWATVAGLLRSKAWQTRVAEGSDLSVVRCVERPRPDGEAEDALETVAYEIQGVSAGPHDAPGQGTAADVDPGTSAPSPVGMELALPPDMTTHAKLLEACLAVTQFDPASDAYVALAHALACHPKKETL
jgi:hypothetical protein